MGEERENCREFVYFRKVNSKGRILLPVQMRETLDVGEGDYVELRSTKDGAWVVRKFQDENRLREFLEGLNENDSQRITHTRAFLEMMRCEPPCSCQRKD